MLCPPGLGYGRHDLIWPNMYQSSISSPDPADDTYEHLPLTLREFSLRYWPHFCAQQQLRNIDYITDDPDYDSMFELWFDAVDPVSMQVPGAQQSRSRVSS